jgi:hypothetical protein
MLPNSFPHGGFRAHYCLIPVEDSVVVRGPDPFLMLPKPSSHPFLIAEEHTLDCQRLGFEVSMI